MPRRAANASCATHARGAWWRASAMPRCRLAVACQAWEKLAGTIRYSAGQLRGLCTRGQLALGARSKSNHAAAARRRADIRREWRGRCRAAAQVVRTRRMPRSASTASLRGAVSAQRNPDDDLWQLSLSSSLGGAGEPPARNRSTGACARRPGQGRSHRLERGVRGFRSRACRANQIRGSRSSRA